MTATAQSAATPVFGITEIEHLIRHDLPEITPETAAEAYRALHLWLAAVQGKNTPTVAKPRIALFLSSYQPDGQDMLQLLEKIKDPRHPLAALAATANADFQVHELGQATADEDMLHAIAYGMMAALPGIDLMILSMFNPAHAASATALLADLAAGTPPLQALLKTRSMDLAAGFGAMAAARLARIPVIADGVGADAILKTLAGVSPGKDNHVKTSQDILPVDLGLPAHANGAFMIAMLRNIAALQK